MMGGGKMDKVQLNKDRLLYGMNKITGIKMEALREYSEYNDIFHIIDHPMTVNATDKQYEKLTMLKDFINSYQYLRQQEDENRMAFTTSELLAKYFVSQLGFYREREMVLVAYVDSKMHIMSCEKASQGTVNASAIFPREILKRALQLDCARIALSHNHPGGQPSPSKEDIAITKRLQAIFQPLNMEVYDHIIVADDKYLSMKEQGIINGVVVPATVKDYVPITLENVSEVEEDMEL